MIEEVSDIDANACDLSLCSLGGEEKDSWSTIPIINEVLENF